MKPSAGIAALLASVLWAGLAWGAACPLCLRQIPEGQKYCKVHAAEVANRRTAALKEKDMVETVVKTRAEYEKSLKTLKQFYLDQANAEKLEKASTELKDLHTVRKYYYRQWEDIIPDRIPSKLIPAAAALYGKAEALRKSVSPFGRERRLRQAAVFYRRIIEKYPTSILVDDAAFQLGDIYESIHFREYKRAIRFYERCFRWNPDTPFPARYRAAYLCDHKLGEYEAAAEFYRLAGHKCRDEELRYAARLRWKTLTDKGFGPEKPRKAAAPKKSAGPATKPGPAKK